MLKILLILPLLIWGLVILRQMAQKGFVVLLIWLVVGPFVTKAVRSPGENPFFQSRPVSDGSEIQDSQEREVRWEMKVAEREKYFQSEATIRLDEVADPTRLLFAGFALLFLLDAFVKRRHAVGFDRTEVLMICFLILATANALLQSRRTAFALRTLTDAFAIPFIAYYVSRRLVTSEKRFQQLIGVLTCLGICLVLVGAMERSVQPQVIHRLVGPFQKRDHYYIVVMVVFFAVLAEWASRTLGKAPKTLLSRIQVVLLGSAPVMIFMTWTRGSWLGFLAGFWIFVFLIRNLITARRKLLMAGLLLLVIPILSLAALELRHVSGVAERVSNEKNIELRLNGYRVILDQVRQHPVFGVGVQNLRDVLMTVREGNMDTAHSSYLALLGELGIVGLVTYLVLMGSMIRRGLILRQGDTVQQLRGGALLAVLLAYLIPGLFDTLVYRDVMAHLYVFIFAGAIVGLRTSHYNQESVKPYHQALQPAVRW